MRYRFGLGLILASLAGFPAMAWAVDITVCGQVVPSGETGLLLADLDCPPLPAICADNPSIPCTTPSDCGGGVCTGAAVVLQKRSFLQLNGHTLKGGGGATVMCAHDCTIAGPGNIQNDNLWTSPMGISVERKATVSDVVIDGGFAGIWSQNPRGRVTATNVVANNSYFYGISIFGVLSLTNVTASNNGGYGIAGAKRLIGDTVTTNNNLGDGIGLLDIRRITNLTAMNNGERGVSARRVRVENGTITGNRMDIVSPLRPRLTGIVCETSFKQTRSLGIDGTWGVCAND